MTGGTLNLASSQGTGDDILSINPQITFFKKVYKRHTNFGLETIEITDSTNSNVNFGQNVTYNITKTGTLINDMHIEFTLPPAINKYGVDESGTRIYKGALLYSGNLELDGGINKLNEDFSPSSTVDAYVGKKIVFYLTKDEINADEDKLIDTITAYDKDTHEITLTTNNIIINGANIDLVPRFGVGTTRILRAAAPAAPPAAEVLLRIYGCDIFEDNESIVGVYGKTTDTPDKTWTNYCCWVNAVGYAILNEVKLEIDGNTIDKHNGLWYDIWNELTDPTRKEWSLVGKRNDDQKLVQNLKSRYYVPLKFYFNRNPGLSFPIFLLNENKVKVSISLNQLNNLLKFDKIPNSDFNTGATITNFKFFTTYVFLDIAEENRIKSNLPNEYLVERVSINENVSETMLSNIVLNNPVKELIWVIRHRDRLTQASAANPAKINTLNNIDNIYPNDIFNYTVHTENTNLGYGTYDTFKSLKISISNKDRVNTTDATFFRTIQPYKHHSNIPGGIEQNEKKKYIYVYSFALNPEEYQPSGSYNFTKSNDSLKFNFTGIGNATDTDDVNHFANYRLDLFAFQYKFLSVYDGKISYRDVPYSSNVQTETIADTPEMKGVEQKIVKDLVKKKCRERTNEAIVEEEKRLIAIEEEVRRRYATHKPDVHRHQNFSKKKWGGLQGQITDKK